MIKMISYRLKFIAVRKSKTNKKIIWIIKNVWDLQIKGNSVVFAVNGLIAPILINKSKKTHHSSELYLSF